MVPSPMPSLTRRAAARTARTCALALALALTLGSGRLAMARSALRGPVVGNHTDFVDHTKSDRASTNPGLGAWDARRAGRARTGSSAGAQPRRNAFLRGPRLQFPGAHEPPRLDWSPETPVRRGPDLPLGWSMGKRGVRHPDAQIVASRTSAGRSPKSTSRLSTAFGRLLNGAQGDRRVQALGFSQPSKPYVRHPLGRAQLVAGARRIMLTKRARIYLGQAADAMNVRQRDPVLRGAVPKYDAPLQDAHTRFVFAELCAGRCGDMKTVGEALRALPASRASIPAHRPSAARAISPAARGVALADASRARPFEGRLKSYGIALSTSGSSNGNAAGRTLQ